MRRSSLVRLYPSRWRRRYEAEFRALLDEAPLSPRLVLDVLAGALGARLAPYPAAEDSAVTTRRLQTATAFLALLLVLPSIVLLAAALVRGLQPAAYEPAHTAAALVDWFATLRAGGAILVVGAAHGLALGVLAVWRRLRADAASRDDLRLLGQVVTRLLRRPALVAGAIVASLAVLAFVIDHAIAG